MKIIVIGAGAAGFFASIICARKYPNAEITLLEAGKDPLAKVRISGGGRCNVTHHCFDNSQLIQYYPRGAKSLHGVFSRFAPKDTIDWFNQEGVKLKTEADGRIFPVTDSSETIVNCLLKAANSAKVNLKTSSPVINILPGFTVVLKKGNQLDCDRIMIATGGSACGHRWAKDLGHHIVTPVPSLFTFNVKDPRLDDLAGVAVELASVSVLVQGKARFTQSGPLLVTHWGISGPAVLKLSAWAARILYENHYHMTLLINWLPAYQGESLKEELLKLKSSYAKKQLYSQCPFNLPKRLWQRLLQSAHINQDKIWAELSKTQLILLEKELRQGNYQIQGRGVFKDEFVTCGGVDLSRINFKTMESKVCPGLYFAGEILDIDGLTGGFNFQSAWTTGAIAGESMGI